MTTKDQKYLKIGLGSLAALVIIYFITSSKTESGSGATDPFNNQTLPNGSTFNAKNIAELLYDAMKDSGTDETAIFNALQGLNESHFQQVVNAFGKRSYNQTLGNQYNWPTWTPGYTPLPLLPLRTWLKSELSVQNYETLRLKYPNLL